MDRSPLLHLPYPQDNDSPDGSAQFEALAKALDNCVLIPSCETGFIRDLVMFTAPTEGVACYRTDLNAFQVYTGGQWTTWTGNMFVEGQGASLTGSTDVPRPGQGWRIISGRWLGTTDTEGYLSILLPDGGFPTGIQFASVTMLSTSTSSDYRNGWCAVVNSTSGGAPAVTDATQITIRAYRNGAFNPGRAINIAYFALGY